MMKKISFVILGLLISATIAQSAIDTSLCAKEPYDISNKFSQVMSTITGSNFIATKAAELAIQSQLKKDMGTKGADVEITPYSMGDFTKGKFKSISINIPSASHEDFAFSNFKAQSLCDFNHVIVEKKQISFAQNFLMSFSTDFTNEDLQKMTSSKKYLDKIGNIKLKIGNFSLLRVTEPSIAINSGKLQMSFGIETPLLVVNNLDKITITSKLKAEKGQLQLANMTINNKKYDMGLLLPIINLINPLSIESKIANNSGIAQIENVDIINDKISLNGIIYIPKNKVIQK